MFPRSFSEAVLVWDLDPARQAQAACALAGRELRPEEWQTYFPGEQQVATCASEAAQRAAEPST